MASDQVQLVRRLRKQGFNVNKGTKHYKVSRPGSKGFVTMPATPSDYRSHANTVASLKNIGYDPEAIDDALLNKQSSARRERALEAARKHNAEIDALTVDYSHLAPKVDPERQHLRDITDRAMGRVVMTDRHEVQVGLSVLSGRACEECKKPFNQCMKNIKGRSRACCGPCSSYDTHDEQVVKELHRWEPYEGEGPDPDSRRHARSFIRQGYSIQSVIARTGVGSRWLADMVGDDGYYRPLR